jgi:hypothetical protein
VTSAISHFAARKLGRGEALDTVVKDAVVADAVVERKLWILWWRMHTDFANLISAIWFLVSQVNNNSLLL